MNTNKTKRPATPKNQHTDNDLMTYWAQEQQILFAKLFSNPNGIGTKEAGERLIKYGPNRLKDQDHNTIWSILISQFKSPLVLILVFASIISIFVGEWTDAIIILVVVLGSTMLGFGQEYRASKAVEELRSRVTLKTTVLRGGKACLLPTDQVVPGDVVLLSAGSLIPADGIVLECNDFFVNQAVLTGETYPTEKTIGSVPANASIAERTNCLYMGTSVRSGTARELIVETGSGTVFGKISERLSLRPDQTDFERGVQNFGAMLTQFMTVMVLIVLSINIFQHKPAIDSLLFALALAVGLAPELLPAIISITLSHGARQMAKSGVIVRRLNAIENFGSMDVLCTDKTGTLTEGVVSLDGALDPEGQPSNTVLELGYANAFFQSGIANPLDEAIRQTAEKQGISLEKFTKVSEIPYDFVRKCLSIITQETNGSRTLVTKGALHQILANCTTISTNGSLLQKLSQDRLSKIEQLFDQWSEKGFRVLGLASKPLPQEQQEFATSDESGLTFQGFLLFFDPPKQGVEKTIQDLKERGVELKIITGDNDKVARHVADTVGLVVKGLLTGKQLNELSDEALWHLSRTTTIFADVDPNQKEKIILALRKMHHVVGYMGDGINDAPALHAADVGISVDNAVDVAKDAADFVLLRQDLGILREGIDVGRVTFANTLKYIMTTISANFGNMFSMAGLSLFLPFLPLLASQILLNNFLSDVPAATIASDNVDAEWVAKPQRWDISFIRDYMVLFGLVSSIFDFLTFGLLLYIFKASPEEFRTGWFIESLLTELVIALVVRTRGVFFRSKPGTLLFTSTMVVIAITLVLPYLPFSAYLGFIPLPAPLLLGVIILTLFYVLMAEAAKKLFYGKLHPIGTIAAR